MPEAERPTDRIDDLSLTLCSSRRALDDPHIRLNYDLLKMLNEHAEWKWIIVDNGIVEGERAFEVDDNRFKRIDGIPISQARYLLPKYRLADALNKAVRSVETRFVLVLDPDCYIVRPGWIDTVLNHMVNEQLSFFGVPFHPQQYAKHRYFPCTHCMFIDLERVRSDDLDFSPEGPSVYRLSSAERRVKSLVQPFVKRKGWSLLRSVVRACRWAVKGVRDRSRIGAAFEAGDNVFRRFANKPHVRCQLAVPVLETDGTRTGRVSAVYRGTGYGILDKVLPDRWSYLPKRKGSFTTTGFRELGYPDLRCRGWEEFMWRGKPFACHLRRQIRGDDDSTEDLAIAAEVIALFGTENVVGRG